MPEAPRGNVTSAQWDEDILPIVTAVMDGLVKRASSLKLEDWPSDFLLGYQDSYQDSYLSFNLGNEKSGFLSEGHEPLYLIVPGVGKITSVTQFDPQNHETVPPWPVAQGSTTQLLTYQEQPTLPYHLMRDLSLLRVPA